MKRNGESTTAPVKKTNAARALDALGIAYSLRTYAIDESDLSAESAAHKLGLPPERIWKTLCVRADDRAVLLAVIPADLELDLKKLAAAAEKRSVAPVPLKELTELTGYVRGGVTALACKKPYAVYLDETAQLIDEFAVSAGQRGLQLVLRPEDYARAVSASLADITRPKALG